LDEIKVGIHYRSKDGQLLTSVPADLRTLEEVTVRDEKAIHACSRDKS
jgi:hypothetical protein